MTECARLLMNGQFGEALSRLEELNSRTALWWHQLGMAHLALGNIDRARAALTEAIEAAPDLSEARVALGLASYLGGKPVDMLNAVHGRARWPAAVLVRSTGEKNTPEAMAPWRLLTPGADAPVPVVFLAHQDPQSPAGRRFLAAAASLACYGLSVRVYSHWAPPDDWDSSVHYTELPDEVPLTSPPLEGIVFTASPALVYDLSTRGEVLPALILEDLPSVRRCDAQSYDRFLSGAARRALAIVSDADSGARTYHGRTVMEWPDRNDPLPLLQILGRILWNSLLLPWTPLHPDRPLLSVAMIARDEEQQIWRSLASVKGLADEIILVDTGSQDATVAIAREHGAQIYHRAWDDDFSAARNAAVTRCSGRWILWLDADEEVYVEDPEGFRHWLAVQDEAVAALVEIRNLEDSGLWAADDARMVVNQAAARLARNLPGLAFRGRVHEDWLPSISDRGPLVFSPLVLYHYGYLKQPHETKAKAQRNLRLIERAVAESPRDGRMQFYLGLERYRRGDYEGAIVQFSQAYRLLEPEARQQHQTFDRLLHFWAETLRLTGRYSEALERIRKARSYFPANSAYWLTESLILSDLGRYEEALWALDQCRRQGPPPPTLIYPDGVHTFQADFIEGLVHGRRQAWREAAEAFERALRRRPLFPQAATEYASAARRAALPAWQERLETILVAVPGRSRARILGEAFFLAEEYERAAYWLALAEASPLTLLRLGICQLRLGKLDEAEATFRSVPEEVPERTEALARICLCHWLAGRWQDAVRLAEEIASRNRRLGDAYLAMAQMAAAPDKPSSGPARSLWWGLPAVPIFEVLEWLIQLEGFTAFERILPVLEAVADPDRFVRLGKLYYRYGFRDLAAETLIRAVREGQADADAYLMLGRLAEDIGLLEDAESFYREAVARQPDSPSPYTHLADFLMRSGRAADAAAVLDSALARRRAT